MRQIVHQTTMFTKRDMANSRNGYPLQELDDKEEFKVRSCAILEDTDEDTGEIKEIGVLISDSSVVYTTISATVIDALYDLIDIINDEGETVIRLGKRQSKGGRTFLTITIL